MESRVAESSIRLRPTFPIPRPRGQGESRGFMILWGGFGVQRSLDAETLLWDAQVITDGRLTLSFQRQRESGFFCEACCLTPRHLSLASRDLTLIACWTAFVERRMPPPPLSPSPAQDIYDSRLFSPHPRFSRPRILSRRSLGRFHTSCTPNSHLITTSPEPVQRTSIDSSRSFSNPFPHSFNPPSLVDPPPVTRSSIVLSFDSLHVDYPDDPAAPIDSRP